MWKADRTRRLDFEITSFCNIKCSGCSRTTSQNSEYYINDKNNMITFEMFKEKVKKNDWPALEAINFCGSVDEPCSHPEIMDILNYIREEFGRDLDISIATNGSLRTEKWWKELGEFLKGSRHTVVWGIDGTDKTSEIYREGSNFERVQKNFRAFNSAGGRSMWQFIEMEHNKHQLEELDDLAKKEGFKSVKVINSARKHGNVDYVKPELEEVEEVQCRYLNEGMVFINAAGDVIPCCYMNSDHVSASKPNWIDTHFPQRQAYIDMWRDHGAQLATNIRYNEIKDVLEGDFFDSVAESWTQENLLDRCDKFCKKKVSLSTWSKKKI